MELRSRHFVEPLREEEISSQADSAALFEDMRPYVMQELLRINGGGVEGAQDKVLHIYRGLWEKQIMQKVVRGVLQIIRTEFDDASEVNSDDILNSEHAEKLIFAPAIEFVRTQLGQVLSGDLEPVEARFRQEVENIVQDITACATTKRAEGHTIGTPRIGEIEPEPSTPQRMFMLQLPFFPRVTFPASAFSSPGRFFTHFFPPSK